MCHKNYLSNATLFLKSEKEKENQITIILRTVKEKVTGNLRIKLMIIRNLNYIHCTVRWTMNFSGIV